MMGLPYGEEIMIIGRTMWTQSTSVTDGQTDRQTDGRTELRSQRPCNAERRTVKIRQARSQKFGLKLVRGMEARTGVRYPLPNGGGVWGGNCAPSAEKFLYFLP